MILVVNKCLGEGGFADVFEGTRKKDNTKVAIKMSKFTKLNDYLEKELEPVSLIFDELVCSEMIKKNPHKNIVSCEFAGIDIETKQHFQVMEYCNSGSVSELINIPPDQCLDICYQTAEALAHLHSLNIIHRDVKIDNIFLHKQSDGKIVYKLADFSLSCMKKILMTLNLGNSLFLAPEMIKQEKNRTFKIDIWGLGVSLYWMLFRKFPFEGKDEVIKDKILKNQLVIPSESKLNPLVKELILEMLSTCPENRPTAIEVMNKITKIKSVLYDSYTNPYKIAEFKMNNSICFSNRGILELNLSKDSEFLVMDSCGNVKMLNLNNKDKIIHKKFDIGKDDIYNVMVLSKFDNVLLIHGKESKSVYVVDPSDMKINHEFKPTYPSQLKNLIFLDNDYFCAGFGDGKIIKYSVSSRQEINKLKIGQNWITSLFVEDSRRELIIGDADGCLTSVNWEPFDKINYPPVKLGADICSICKSQEFFVVALSNKLILILSLAFPPTVTNKIKIESDIIQLKLIPMSINLLVLCWNKLMLFKKNNNNLDKVIDISYTSFDSSDLTSFGLMQKNKVIVGNEEGSIFYLELLPSVAKPFNSQINLIKQFK